jgi:hypothetical protein
VTSAGRIGVVLLATLPLLGALTDGPVARAQAPIQGQTRARRVAPAAPAVEPEEDFPVPPIPPDLPPSFRDAPVPDNEAAGPTQAPQSGARLDPKLFNPKDYNIGQGYTPGSTVQSEQRRRAPPTPGFDLRVPLQ